MSTGMSALAGGLGWAGAGAAAAGGLVGSVAGQLAGKAMGVVESFSLRNAFASAFTAGATAGMGHLMGVGGQAAGKFTEIAKEGAKATLDTYGKMALAASSVGINVGANKLAGNNQASFKWRNVVTAAATAGVMDKLNLDDIDSPWGRATSNLDFGSGIINGFAGAAVGYGVGKALYNKGGWNFRDVATDVFGNAVGNSIVGHYVKKDLALTQYMEEIGLNPQDANERKIVANFQAASRPGVSAERYADALEAMDSLFPEHSADADPRKLNMASLTASTIPVSLNEENGVTITYKGLDKDGTTERFAYTGKRLAPLPNNVMDWTAQQNVKAVTSSVAVQARSNGNGNRLPAVPMDFNIQQGATGRNVFDMQRVISSYDGYNQPVLGRAGSTTMANLERFKKDYAAGTLVQREAGVNPTQAQINAYAAQLSDRHGVPLELLLATIQIESSGYQFNPTGAYQGFPNVAVAKDWSSTAVGLMQVTNDNALADFNKKNPLGIKYNNADIAWDWQKNMDVGAFYLNKGYNLAQEQFGHLPKATIYQKTYGFYHDGNFNTQSKAAQDAWSNYINGKRK